MATEATRTRPITSPPAPASDPYFYGWRMVPRWDDRRRQTWEKVPLTPWDVLHPEEEDFIVTSDAHDRDIHYLKDVFEDRLKERPGMRVLCDHRVLWGPPALGAHGPDVAVFENLNAPWNALRATFPVAELGARPVVVIEVTSPSTRYIDLDDKVEDYHKAGVPLYIIADRREGESGAFIRLLAYRTTPDGYVQIFNSYPGLHQNWWQSAQSKSICGLAVKLFASRDVNRTSIQQQASKAVINNQICRVAFNAVATTNFNNSSARESDQRKY